MKKNVILQISCALFTGLILIQIVACSHAQKVDFPDKRKRVPLRGKRVVVSNVLMAFNNNFKTYEGSKTTSYGTYDKYRFSRKTKKYDVSRALAKYLRRHGIRARHARNFRLKRLKRNEVLLTGAISSTNKPSISVINAMFMCLFMGAIYPNPFGFKLGADIEYTYILVDSKKRILLNSGIREGEVFHKWYFVWHVLGGAQHSYHKKVLPRAMLEIFKDIRKSLVR